VRGSFQDGAQTVDCIDWDKQPACAQNPGACGDKPPPPPPVPTDPNGRPMGPPPDAQNAPPQGPACPEGTIPIVRPSMEVLRRFRTLDDFFRKDPPPPVPPAAAAGH
jgi:hypothetical protein